LTQSDTELEDLLAREPQELERYPPEYRPESDQAPSEPEISAAEEPDLSQARSLLTGPRPAGFGEVLVTNVWAPPTPTEESDDQAEVDPQRTWESRQELRELGLLRESSLHMYDARTEAYWGQVREAVDLAEHAIIDPYTSFAASFADADMDGISAHRRRAREYGRSGEALLEVGRAYVAIGRLKSAQGVLRAAAKADPFNPKIWYNLGLAHIFARSNAAAAHALQRALDQMPGDFTIELALAVAHYHRRDYAAAEHCLRRIAGSGQMRAVARSMLACSLRMQAKWDDARVELSFLRDALPGDWSDVARQCLDCVERGDQKRSGPLRTKRRAKRLWQSLASGGVGAGWVAYALSENLFREHLQWAALPLLLVVVMLARGLRGIGGGELPGEFGNAEQGLPCWQTTPWLRQRRSEF